MRDTTGYKRLEGVIRGYRRVQRVKEGYNWLQRDSDGYTDLQGVTLTKIYLGVTGGYK